MRVRLKRNRFLYLKNKLGVSPKKIGESGEKGGVGREAEPGDRKKRDLRFGKTWTRTQKAARKTGLKRRIFSKVSLHVIKCNLLCITSIRGCQQ